MTYGHGQGIGRIRRRRFGKIQDCFHHLLYLVLFRPSISHHGLFYFQRRIFAYGDVIDRCDQQHCSPGMPLSYQTFYVFPVENIFNNDNLRIPAIDHIHKGIVNILQTRRKRLSSSILYFTMGEVLRIPLSGFYYAKAGYANAWIYPEYYHRVLLSCLSAMTKAAFLGKLFHDFI